MKEINVNENIEVEEFEGLPKLDKGICVECKKPMTEFSNKYKCFKCGIEVEK